MENNEMKMTVWIVAPGEHYNGENVDRARVFRTETAARAYEGEVLGELGVDYVVVREVPLG